MLPPTSASPPPPPSPHTHNVATTQVKCHFDDRTTDFAFITWFGKPTYPDGDPLTVDIDLHGDPIPGPKIIVIDEIDPARILYKVDRGRHRMSMMRIEGLNVSPELSY